jgi:hypothetical protein
MTAVDGVGDQVARIRAQTGAGQRRKEAVLALAGEVHAQRRADKGNALVAKAQQARHRHADAGLVIVIEPGIGGAEVGAAMRDKGKTDVAQESDALVVYQRAAHHQAVDAPSAHNLLVRGQLVLRRRRPDDEVHLARFQRFRHAAHGIEEHRVAQVGR